jgi:hypothetical protein
VNAAAQAPGIGDFTIVIGDHDARANPINALPQDRSDCCKVVATDY